MADAPKPEPVHPAVAAQATAPTSIVTVAPRVPFNPPALPETPPGGKFGIRDFEIVNGKRVEKIRYVNAHGLPFSDDPNENMKDK